MSYERFAGKKIATLATVLALGGLAACGSDSSTKEAPSAHHSPAGPYQCDGLPPYKVVGRSKATGFPLLQFKSGEDCVTNLYDETTGRNIPHGFINQDSSFYACYAGGKPDHVLAVLAEEDHIGPTGAINLGYGAARQLAELHDIPGC